ncbi:DUF1622 domain-containing protein [Pyxidicoccus sp. MSG2]|uniref:DUF1622 domain-containing protein n=1 Tax=Pyxidicoccus sp. MSG2 TaxID=2996790 RepID=UPI00227063CA|nr:DUF1622 domain-containing protein [Pyxidicoccus sp. MSG2]MCY1015779.1 DUF1622 domain-containing protein [Pyxidicoccus sp. MSG2]
MEFTRFVALAAWLFEALGVSVMVLGVVLAAVVTLVRDRGRSIRERYRLLRTLIGSPILLGLELLVAADIIRTVTESPTLGQVFVLGLIVLIRTFLSFTLEVELEGRWPWQQGPRSRRGTPPVEEEEGGSEPPLR